MVSCGMAASPWLADRAVPDRQVKAAIVAECKGSEVTAFKVDVTNRAEVRIIPTCS